MLSNDRTHSIKSVENYYISEIDGVYYINADANSIVLARKVCYVLCFSDCTEEHVEKVVLNGREVVYAGWQPNMRYVLKDKETGEVVFDACFPEWDH